MDLLDGGDLRATAVLEILGEDGKPQGLLVVLVDGSSIVCTVWTDWIMRLERTADSDMPDYFWPRSAHSYRPLLRDLPSDGLEITRLVTFPDEVGNTMAVEMEVGGRRISARSFGGEIVLSDEDLRSSGGGERGPDVVPG